MLEKNFSNNKLYTFMCLMVFSGSLTTIANKMQQNSTSLGKKYHHVWFVVFCMFFGKFLSLFFYFLIKMLAKKENDKNPLITNDSHIETKNHSLFLFFAIPMFCDFLGSTAQIFGLIMVPGSIYQIFRGSLVVFTALLSGIFLKSKLFFQHYLGIIFVILGLFIIWISMEVFPFEHPDNCPKTKKESNPFLGIFLVVLGQFFSAGQYVVEEKLMKNSDFHPLKVIGIEGIWGLIFSFIVLLALSFVECDSNSIITPFICSENDSNEWKGEDAIFALRQLTKNVNLSIWAITYMLSITICNYTGTTITKFIASSNRTMVDVMKNIFVWGFFLMPFQDECIRENFSYLEFVGLLITSLGTIIYNKLKKEN
jgi:drug/metabolite transporter (DMT)-like permease